MGQDISKAHTPPPLSFRDSLVDGRINVEFIFLSYVPTVSAYTLLAALAYRFSCVYFYFLLLFAEKLSVVL